ncbi:MAG: O-antigen ligase family protein [Microgenomates group bacterium]|jgi:O-antigen ligase
MIIQPLLYFLLFGLMLFIIPFSISPYEVPKVITAILFIIIIGSITIFQNFHNLINFKNKYFLIFLYLILSTLYFLLIDPSLIWGNETRPQGTLIYLSLFLLFLAAKKLPFDLKLVSKITSFTLPVLLLFTLIIGPRASFRFIGPLGEANALGTAVLFLFPFTSLIKNQKLKYLGIFCAAILILMCGSRIALLAFVLETLIIYFRKFRLIFIPGIIVTALIFIFALIFPFLPRQIPDNLSLRFESRTDIWTVSYQAGFDSPILGQGFGSMEDSINKKAWETKNFIRFQAVDSAHNLFLNWWIMGGLVGVLIITSLITIALRNFYLQKNWIFLSILIGLLTVQLFNPVSIVSLVQFWWILGMGFQNKTT